jgi:amidase
LHWKQRAAIKREQQFAQIPPEWRLDPLPSPLPTSTLDYINSCQLLTPLEHSITSTTSATRLLSQIKSREVSSLQVATAFCKRAAIAQQLSRCCTEMFFGKALKRAQELDRYLEDTGELYGPLHGLPVSLKDGTDIEGEDTTLGMSFRSTISKSRH